VPLAIFCADDRDAQLTGPTDTDGNAIGWSHHAERMPYVARIPGTHITMLQKPNVNALADQITRFLVKIKTHA
jgi:thioesterase domain-containing protein